MKLIKMLGLVALAALMAMAFVGTTSATAETVALCDEAPGAEEEEPTCPEGHLLSHVHEASVGKGKLLSSSVTVECNVLFLGEVISPNDLATFLMIEGNFTYTNCASCSVEEVSENTAIVVRKTGHETAQVLGEGEVHVNCASINCYYSGVGLEAAAKGPSLSNEKNGEVSIQEQAPRKVKGFFCPEKAKLDLVTTPLAATYIAS